MSFNPALKIGQVLTNADLVTTFKCGNMGGMRRSKATNTLVIISDYTKGLYHDKWIDGVLHYTGMGKSGNQDIHWAQNATLAECNHNGVDVHLFEVINAGEYIYCGKVALVAKPYTELQLGDDGNPRTVWMFPIRPVPDNDVIKPPMFVFKNIDDYQARGRNVDAEYAQLTASTKKAHKKSFHPQPIIIKSKDAPQPTIPQNIIGKRVFHKSFGAGIITDIYGESIAVLLDEAGEKRIGYEFCIRNNLLNFM